ncbi:MAG: universal stress protein [Acidobacteriota bacterium]|nr:universal stress protein [Acidobacteriota bacterium]
MYKTIYVPVDNSDYSNRAIDVAVELGKTFGSKMVGCHVYAAKMHDYRFKQMEYTLPDEYLEENELDRQRKIHDSLITMGLQLISDSYLDPMKKICAESGLEFEGKMMDGKHSTELARDINESDYDLVVLGVLGLGRVKDSQIGSVCERVTRSSDKDVLVIKRVPNGKSTEPGDTILVGLDGSPQSFGALKTAIDLGKRFNKKVEAIAVYDPYLHYSVFNSIVGVLTEKAAKVFRFEEQNQLHEEIIDTGLAQIYQSHLDVAQKVAEEDDTEITRTLLDGKAFQKILDHARKTNPWLLVVGRVGIHAPEGETGLGSNTENLIRSCPCDMLITTRCEIPELDVRAEETIRWTPEAEKRMDRVPPMVVGIARTAIYRLAIEKGHSVITSDLLDEAMDRFMPKGSAMATTQLAESLVLEQAKQQPISICKQCGIAASEPEPAKCSVCGGVKFQVISPEVVEEIIKMEGGFDEEKTYDGRSLKWTQDAKRALRTMKDAYTRRRTKARVEKNARMRRMSTVTLEFAREIVEEETGKPLDLEEAPTREEVAASDNIEDARTEDGKKLIARDGKNNPLLSTFDWTEDAIKRVLRVPAGFMRDRTQTRIEEIATERSLATIDLAVVEDGIEHGRQMMAEMISNYSANPEEARKAPEMSTKDTTAEKGNGRTSGPALNETGLMGGVGSMEAKGED